MPTLEGLTEADLRAVLTSGSLSKARGYLNRLRNLVRSGSTLSAQVSGTYLYEVEIEVAASGISAHCSCPYDWGGFCKHIGAVLLWWIRSPSSFAVVEAPPFCGEYPIEVIPVEPPPTSQPEERPFWLVSTLEDRQHADRQRLETWLVGMKQQDLRHMARKRGWQVKGTSKAQIVRQLVEYLASPDEIRKAVLDLDGEHRLVLRAMVLLAGEESCRLEDLARVAGSWGALKSHKQMDTYTRHLCEAGLAVPGRLVSSYPPRSDFIPRAVSRHLPPLLEETIPATTDLGSDQPASELRLADPYVLIRAASQIVLLLEQSPPPLRPPMPRPRMETRYPNLAGWDYDPDEVLRAKQDGKLLMYSDLSLSVPPPLRSLPDDAIQRLAPVAGDEARLEFIFSLLVASGVLQPGSPVTIWPEVKEQFLRRDELTQRAILARTYLYMGHWSELWELLRDPPADRLSLRRVWKYPYFKPEHLRAHLLYFRHVVLRVLANLPDDKWVALGDLIPLMRIVWPRLDGAVGLAGWYPSMTGNWFLSKAGSDKPLGPEDWDLAQGSFIRYILAGPLHWLGLADLSFESGVLAAVRLHGLAGLYWDQLETPPAPRHVPARTPSPALAAAVTTDDCNIGVNPSAISAQAHSLLDKIARLEVANADCFVYRLDPHAAHQAFEAGVALSEILDDWERLLVVPMPEAIQARLSEWWDAYGRVRIYEHVTIIEFGDDYALAEMKAVTSLDEHLIAEISPRLVLIPEQALAPLMAELEAAGYTPKQTDQV
jgi:hypothetical protein